MRTTLILSVTAATLLAAPLLQAQAPAPAAPTTPGAPAAPAATAPAATAPADPAAKPKPLSMNDAKSLSGILEVMQFHIRMGEVGRHKLKEDKEFVAFASKTHKDMTALWTPAVNLAMNRGVDSKNIPSAVSRADKADIDRLQKNKETDKWKLEYFELLAKNGKKNARSAENSLKIATDPELKEMGAKVVALLNSQAEQAESEFKELKSAKK